MSKVRLYNISDDYIEYLLQFENKVFSNKVETRKKRRKYLGVVLEINDLNYFVPLSSPKRSDYIFIKEKRKIRKSIIPIIRIIAKDKYGYDELQGTLKFSNMIPVPECGLINYDVESEPDENYKILILKELSFIFDNEDRIIKNAKIIYRQKINNYDNIGYINHTIDFKLLEKKCLEYELLEAKKQVASTTKNIKRDN